MIELTSEQLDGINARISTNTLLEEDKRIVLAIISIYTWLHQQLERQKLSIKRLKKLFGFSTERRKKHKKKDPTPPELNDSDDDTTSSNDKGKDKLSKKYPSGTH